MTASPKPNIQQEGISVWFEAARQNLFEWYEQKHGSGDGLGCGYGTDPDNRVFRWIPAEAHAFYEACCYYEQRSIWSIIYERLVRRALFVKARLRGLVR